MAIEIELVVPLDYLILDLLPKEGSMSLGVYPDGALASDIRAEIAGGKLTANQISTRLRVMNLGGYTVKMRSLGKNVWQRTREGERVLEEWRKQHAASS